MFSISLTIFLWFSCLSLMLMYALLRSKRRSKFPPGPPSIPILGSLPFVDLRNNPVRLAYKKLAEKYGNVFCLSIGSKQVVVISGFKNIQQALVTQAAEFGGRSVHRYRSQHFNPGPNGIGGSNTTPEWHNQHRLGLSILRSLGYGRGTTETRIVYECNAMKNLVYNQRCQPFEPTEMMKTGCMNVICELIMGRHYEHGDQDLKKLMSLMDDFIDLIFKDTDGDVIPLLRYRPGHVKSMKQFKEVSSRLVDFILELIKEKKIEYESDECEESDDDEPKRDNFVRAYMRELKKINAGKKNHKSIQEDWLYTFILDMVLTGSQSVPTVMSWFILYMMKHPNIQKKVQAELDSVYGDIETNPDVSLDMKHQLPYTQATICEMMRLSCVSPLGYPHSTTADVDFQGFQIPANTEVWVNLWETTRDPTLCDSPEECNPERFLNNDGELEVPDYWIPFGIGKRACFGEQLARQEMFLIFTTMLRNFDFLPPEGMSSADVNVQPIDGVLVLKPHSYQTCAIPRARYSKLL